MLRTEFQLQKEIKAGVKLPIIKYLLRFKLELTSQHPNFKSMFSGPTTASNILKVHIFLNINLFSKVRILYLLTSQGLKS